MPVSPIPLDPKIYHITHVGNLPSILTAGVIWSDAERILRGLSCALVGMSSIKQRRLTLPVDCYQGTMVGQYVPFYFCPRSIMLFILHKANHPDIDYREGQRPILHLQVDLRAAIRWAENASVLWAFSDRNAGTRFACFYNQWVDLDKVNWSAVRSTDFRDMEIKEGKQAEFLIYGSFPWHLVEKIGVLDQGVVAQVDGILAGVDHRPLVRVERGWYY